MKKLPIQYKSWVHFYDDISRYMTPELLAKPDTIIQVQKPLKPTIHNRTVPDHRSEENYQEFTLFEIKSNALDSVLKYRMSYQSIMNFKRSVILLRKGEDFVEGLGYIENVVDVLLILDGYHAKP